MLLIFGGGGIAEGIKTVWRGPVIVLSHEDCDVRGADQVQEMFDRYRPTAVVNCAGVSCPDDWPLEIETNLTGAANVAIHSRVPTVLIGSVAGLYGKPGHAGYSASKAGVISLVQSLALEGKEIWCVSPGRVDTPMRERDYPQDTPGSRLEPSQVGQVVVNILARGLYETGTNVVIRKVGLDTVVTTEHQGDGWKDRLRVGLPVTI